METDNNNNSTKSESGAISGLLLLIAGIVITAVTYSSACENGGTYIIAFGPIIFGAIKFFKNL
jgi:uncharacterized membrane protein